eukprot:2229117-Rhodomonas_salina.2
MGEKAGESARNVMRRLRMMDMELSAERVSGAECDCAFAVRGDTDKSCSLGVHGRAVPPASRRRSTPPTVLRIRCARSGANIGRTATRCCCCKSTTSK